jgi:hypothetical protein
MPPNRLLMRRCLQSETGFHFASQDANSSGEVRILPNGKLDFPKILRTRKGGSTIIEISQSSSSKIPIFFDGLGEQEAASSAQAIGARAYTKVGCSIFDQQEIL